MHSTKQKINVVLSCCTFSLLKVEFLELPSIYFFVIVITLDIMTSVDNTEAIVRFEDELT
jgi:hypothetical protein